MAVPSKSDHFTNTDTRTLTLVPRKKKGAEATLPSSVITTARFSSVQAAGVGTALSCHTIGMTRGRFQRSKKPIGNPSLRA